jgi:hypothetical protein
MTLCSNLVSQNSCKALHSITWYHMVSQGITRYHKVSQCVTWYHNVSHGITRYHNVSQGITMCHMVSQGITRYHMVSQCVTRCHMVSQGIRHALYAAGCLHQTQLCRETSISSKADPSVSPCCTMLFVRPTYVLNIKPQA